jgi:ribosomal protein S18 acetylase RimI-like enzyme
VYLGKITVRKNQKKYQSIPQLDFIGNLEDYSFDIANDNYLGEWSRDQIHKHLTQYTNLLLISQGEADPLVVKEALIAGLGVVVNKSSSENLDTSLDFITVLEEDKLEDLMYVQNKLEENRKICLSKRHEIRDYGVRTFDISNEVDKYLNVIRGV